MSIKWVLLRLLRGFSLILLIFFARLTILAPTASGIFFSAGTTLFSLLAFFGTFGQQRGLYLHKALLFCAGAAFVTLSVFSDNQGTTVSNQGITEVIESTSPSMSIGVMSEEDLIEAFSPLLYLNDPARGLHDYAQLKQKIQALYSSGKSHDRSSSMIGDGVFELLTWSPMKGGYRIFVPEQCRANKCPLLLFLHGAFGNLKAYTYVLHAVAKREGVILLSPSYGVGMWYREEVPQMLREILLQVAERVQYSDVNILGYSNGAMGALLSEELVHPSRVFLLSPMLPLSLIKKLPRGEDRAEITVIYGDADVNIPPSMIDAGIDQLKTQGYTVGSERVPSADHYLFFREQSLIADRVARWLRR